MFRKYQRWTCDTPDCIASADGPIEECPRLPKGWARVSLSFENGTVEAGGVSDRPAHLNQ